MQQTPAAQIKMTADEFKSLPETTAIVELIEGVVIMSPAPKDRHQQVLLRLVRLVHLLLPIVPSGELRFAPTDVYLDGSNAVQPDLFWVNAQRDRCALGDDEYWYGAPDLIVEVLSSATAARDRGVKFDLYAKHGVSEYWLVDTTAQFVEVYVQKGGRFERLGLFEVDATFTSPVIAAQISIARLFE